MRHSLLAFLSALALMPGAAACAEPAARAEVPATLQWRVDPVNRDPDQVQFELSYRTAHSRSNYSRTTALAQLEGLTRAALDGASSGPVRFRMVRDSGTFEC